MGIHLPALAAPVFISTNPSSKFVLLLCITNVMSLERNPYVYFKGAVIIFHVELREAEILWGLLFPQFETPRPLCASSISRSLFRPPPSKM